FSNGISFGCAGSGGMLQLTFVVTGYRSETHEAPGPRDRSFGDRLYGALAYMRRRRVAGRNVTKRIVSRTARLQ
ncbi:MAG: hypothetical protein QOH10_59, partial [Actinomycetota bacterium]|nr:hypothetical protein [Actinomycetota bacterium]